MDGEGALQPGVASKPKPGSKGKGKQGKQDKQGIKAQGKQGLRATKSNPDSPSPKVLKTQIKAEETEAKNVLQMYRETVSQAEAIINGADQREPTFAFMNTDSGVTPMYTDLKMALETVKDAKPHLDQI